MLESFHTKVGKCEMELRNRFRNNNISVSVERDKILIEVMEFSVDNFEYKLSKYYANWKEVYNLNALCDKVMLMHTFGVADR
jgi:hypothetical protein